MNGDYLSNGNGVSKSNSNEELATTQQTLQRDNVEDDLDAEMPQSPPTSASTANLMIPTNGSLNSMSFFFKVHITKGCLVYNLGISSSKDSFFWDDLRC